MPIVDVEGQCLQYEDTGGDGPALIFSHSFAMNGSMFAPQIEAFSQRFRCVTWDERAHGASFTDGPFTFWDSARDCLALLSYLHIDQATFIGTSQGGFISLRVALLAPSRVRGLVVLGTSAALEAPVQKQAYKQLHAAFVGDGKLGGQEAVLETMANISFGPAFDAEPWKRVWRNWPPAQAALALDALIERDDLLPRLGEIQAPTLVMHGADDKSYPPSHGEAIANGVAKSAGFVLVPKGAHFLSLTDPADVNRGLAPFLNAV
jgi:3-oxoadipate enol-lactonase